MIQWDHSDTKSAYANVFNAAGSREEIGFLFGQGRPSDKEEIPAQLTNRVAVNPMTAKRLLSQLNRVIREYGTAHALLPGSLHARAER